MRRSKHLMAAALNLILLVNPKTAHMQPCALVEGANVPFGSRNLRSLILHAPTLLDATLMPELAHKQQQLSSVSTNPRTRIDWLCLKWDLIATERKLLTLHLS